MSKLAQNRGLIFSLEFQTFMMILSSILLKTLYKILYYKCMLNLSQRSEVLLVKVAFSYIISNLKIFIGSSVSFRKLVITLYRNVKIEFRLLRLKLDS